MYLKVFWFIIYNVFILPILLILTCLVSPFIKKVRLGLIGRRTLFEKLQEVDFQSITKEKKKKIWIHVASAGELEQALPIIEAIKKKNPRHFILLTFFSPSGLKFYEKVKSEAIDLALYSPIDTPLSVMRFLHVVKPDLLILSKYDIWPNMIWLSWITRVNIIMINGSLQKLSKRSNLATRYFYKALYSCFKFIGTITESDAERFLAAVNNKEVIEAVGDTKYDRVLKRKETRKFEYNLNNYLKGKTLILASIWEEDEKILFPVIKNIFNKFKDNFSLIVVPHEPNFNNIEKWKKYFSELRVSYSVMSDFLKNQVSAQTLIIDTVGHLAELYRFSKIAYIGGAFSKGGVHNILEAAIYGNPTIFGPKYLNSYEAKIFVKDDLSKVVTNCVELEEYLLKLLQDENYYKTISGKHFEKTLSLCGATGRYLTFIEKFIV